MKRSAFRLALILLCLFSLAGVTAAKETWTKVTSKNFTLVGNASEKDIRQVATRLEQFREVFSLLFTKARFDSVVPTTVIVFKNMDAYRPFNPQHNAGYFQAGEDVNYITLTSEPRRSEEEDPFSTIYHEYVHLLVKNNMQGVPLWVNEGLAEFYRTFEVLKDGTQVMIGKPISYHVLYMREQKFLPLQTLLNVGDDSPYYNEGSKRGVFYAQSWALIHYLQLGAGEPRQPQFVHYLQLLAAGTPSETAFRTAFQSDFAAVEKEMKSYVNRNSYKTEIFTLKDRLAFDASMQATVIPEAEAQGYLGDLLLHTHQLADAEKYIQKTLELDPNLPMAHASLGMLRFQQGRMEDAQKELALAVAGDSRNFLAHYYYAFALTHERTSGEQNNNDDSGLSPETATLIRTHLKRAIELAPHYAESYNLHAYLSLLTGNLDEAMTMIKRALELAPGRHDEFAMTLAQIYMRRNDFKAARQLLEPIEQKGSEEYLRHEASQLLNSVKEYEEYEAKRKEYEAQRADVMSSSSSSSSADMASSPPALKRRGGDKAGADSTSDTTTTSSPAERAQPSLATLRPRAAGEQQIAGLLVQIECTSRGALLIVKVGERLLKFDAGKFEHVEFVSYAKEMGTGGEITCGARHPANNVLITYRPSASVAATDKPASSKTPALKSVAVDGEVVAVDFVPADWK